MRLLTATITRAYSSLSAILKPSKKLEIKIPSLTTLVKPAEWQDPAWTETGQHIDLPYCAYQYSSINMFDYKVHPYTLLGVLCITISQILRSENIQF